MIFEGFSIIQLLFQCKNILKRQYDAFNLAKMPSCKVLSINVFSKQPLGRIRLPKTRIATKDFPELQDALPDKKLYLYMYKKNPDSFYNLSGFVLLYICRIIFYLILLLFAAIYWTNHHS